VSDIDPERRADFAKKYPGWAAVASGKLADIIDDDDAAAFSR